MFFFCSTSVRFVQRVFCSTSNVRSQAIFEGNTPKTKADGQLYSHGKRDLAPAKANASNGSVPGVQFAHEDFRAKAKASEQAVPPPAHWQPGQLLLRGR